MKTGETSSNTKTSKTFKHNKMKAKLVFYALIFAFSSNSQVIDINGNAYKTLKIGKQEWMVKNLNVSKFQNGDIIPEASCDIEWEKAMNEKKPAWCYYSNDPRNGEKFGKIYNWYAVIDPRGIAPKGWHVPSVEEFIELSDNARGKEIYPSSPDGFVGPALGSGWRFDNGIFYNYGGLNGNCNLLESINWFSSTPSIPGDNSITYYALSLKNTSVSNIKDRGFYVRCIKD